MFRSKSLVRMFSGVKMPNINHTPSPFQGNPQQIIAKRNKYYSHLYQPYYKTPLIITQGRLQYLYDNKGNRYIDLQTNDGLVNIGHSHPAIQKVIKDNAGYLIHTSTIYMSQSQGELSKRLLEEVGSGFDTVYLCNSTGEAIDYSVLFTRVYKEEANIYSYRNGYHGVLGNARTVTNLGKWSSSRLDKLDSVKLTYPTQQGSFQEAKQLITTNGFPGGLVYEPIQTKAGVRMPINEELKRTVDYFKELKGITICDQSGTGLGRIGQEGFGFKWQNTIPDVIVLGNVLGNGSSLSAVIARRQILTCLKNVWFNTFAAGHMQTKLGLAVLDTIKKQNLYQNSQLVGAELLKGLRQKAESSKHHVKEVRGKGLLIGIEVENKQKALQLQELGRERGLLFGLGGSFENVLLVRPALCISKEDAHYIVDAFGDCLSSLK